MFGLFKNCKCKREYFEFTAPILSSRAPEDNDKSSRVWIHRDQGINDVYVLIFISNDKSEWIKI